MPSLGAVLMEENDEAYDKIKELEEEIGQLRAINNVSEAAIESLEEEKKKLKSELKERLTAHQNCDRWYYELKEEIMKLKSENKSLQRTMSRVDTIMHQDREYLEKLYNENKQLNQQIQCHKERIAILSELLDVADAIIDLGDNEKAKETWENKNADLNLAWKQVLKKYKEDVE